MNQDPQRWLRYCPIHNCRRSFCNTKHYGEKASKIELPKNFNNNFKNALGSLIQGQSKKSLTCIQASLGWDRRNLNSIFRFGNSNMTIQSAYKICLAAGIDIVDVFILAESLCAAEEMNEVKKEE